MTDWAITPSLAGQVGVGAARGVVTDFRCGLDKIDLSALSAACNGTGGLLGGGVASFFHCGPGGVSIGDQNGDGVVDWVLELQGAPGVAATDS